MERKNKIYENEMLQTIERTHRALEDKLKKRIANLELKTVHLIQELQDAESKLKRERDLTKELQEGYIKLRTDLKEFRLGGGLERIDREFLTPLNI